MADTRTNSVFEWLVYFRDRILPPMPQERADGRLVVALPYPGYHLCADERDIRLIEKLLTVRQLAVSRPHLTKRQQHILVEMLAAGATCPSRDMKRDEIRKAIAGKSEECDVSTAVAGLGRLKLTERNKGRDGGVWLSEAGRAEAETLTAENQAG